MSQVTGSDVVTMATCLSTGYTAPGDSLAQLGPFPWPFPRQDAALAQFTGSPGKMQ